MANVTITIDDTNIVDVRDTLCVRLGYDGNGTNADKVAFLKAKIARWIKDEYKLGKGDVIKDATIVTAEQVSIS